MLIAELAILRHPSELPVEGVCRMLDVRCRSFLHFAGSICAAAVRILAAEDSDGQGS